MMTKKKYYFRETGQTVYEVWDKRYTLICPEGGRSNQQNPKNSRRRATPPRSAHYQGLYCFHSQLGLSGLSGSAVGPSLKPPCDRNKGPLSLQLRNQVNWQLYMTHDSAQMTWRSPRRERRRSAGE